MKILESTSTRNAVILFQKGALALLLWARNKETTHVMKTPLFTLNKEGQGLFICKESDDFSSLKYKRLCVDWLSPKKDTPLMKSTVPT